MTVLPNSFPVARRDILTPRLAVVIPTRNRRASLPRTLASVQMLCCPDCGTPTPQIISGREMDLVALEVES